jgi:plasmid stability protein
MPPEDVFVSELVIPDLDAQVLTRLGQRAGLHGRTVEGEANQILAKAVREWTGTLGRRSTRFVND